MDTIPQGPEAQEKHMTDDKRLQVFLNPDEWTMLETIMESEGSRSRSDTVRRLIRKEFEKHESS